MTNTVPLKRLVDERRPIMYGIVLPGPNQDEGPMIIKGGDVKPDGLHPARLCRTTVEIESRYERSRVAAGDIVIAIRGGVGDTGIVPPEVAGANLTQDVARVAPRASIDRRWLHYAMRSRDVQLDIAARVTGATVRGLNIEELNEVRMPRPPLHDQQLLVADYLDLETAHIDTLIAKKRRLVSLLDERVRGVADDAIALLRDTEDLVPLKYVVTESDRRLGHAGTAEVLSVSIHRGVVPRSEINDRESRADEFGSYKLCVPGQVVLNRMRAFQGGVGVVRDAGIVSPDYTVLTPSGAVLPEFLHFLMRSNWFVGEMVQRLRGIGSTDQGAVRTPRVNYADLGQIEIPVPDVGAQYALAVRLAEAADRALQTRDRIVRQIDLLAEHRQALITAAVTGQITVPGAA